jgi:hypothetical protein
LDLLSRHKSDFPKSDDRIVSSLLWYFRCKAREKYFVTFSNFFSEDLMVAKIVLGID